LLYVTDAEAIGGAESYLRTLLLHADRRRYQVGLLLPPRSALQPLVDEARAHGIEISTLDQVHSEGLDRAAIMRAARTFRQLRPDIVHFNLPAPRRSAEAVLAAALVGVRRRLATFQLVTPVPRFRRLNGWVRSLNRQVQYRTLHQGIAVSAGNWRLLVDQYGFPAARLQLIYNGVDTDHFVPGADGAAIRQAWGIPAGELLLGVVGRLSHQKGHRSLFAALPAIWAAFPDTHVALIGSGELEDQLRAEAASLDSSGRIHFVGQQRQMPQALAALDLFVLPSLYEGLPFAALEAMAMQRAIVATAVDGIAELIEHERTGLVVPVSAPERLAEAIARLLADPSLRAQLGRAARAKVEAEFNQRSMIERTFALYTEPS
jgi:glycosyltransferase involved in cell wall biosynthesis